MILSITLSSLPICYLRDRVMSCTNNFVYLASVLVLVGCGGGGGSGSPGSAAASCGPYPEQTTSLYILPYEVGTGHRMVHGNCTAPGTSHQAGGTRQYAYDFEMPIGTILIAAREILRCRH